MTYSESIMMRKTVIKDDPEKAALALSLWRLLQRNDSCLIFSPTPLILQDSLDPPRAGPQHTMVTRPHQCL